MILRIPRDSFLVFSTSSTLYDISGGIGSALGGGVVYGFSLASSGGVGAGVGC